MNSLDLFHPLIKDWFCKKYGSPTDIQEKTWPEIASSKNVLVTAPTGSGKTLTAFLWAINCLVTGKYETGKLSVLYISPLKALNNDILKNLISPLSELKEYFAENSAGFKDIRVMTRSGDTTEEERRLMVKKPPEILITTPESLNILLTSKNARNILRGIKSVILDEIHSISSDKRGTYLITAVDRLTLLCGEFQRIALSATVRPMEKIAAFVGGYSVKNGMKDPVYEKRDVAIIRSSDKKNYELNVRYPDFETDGFNEEPVWNNLAAEFKDIISSNNSTLLFANSRRFVEKITRLINESADGQIAYSHHGSLSKELRLSVEQKLKEGKLKSIVATNSLELGIDIGRLDRVILIQTPFSISSAIQRIGRSGHGVGETSKADIYPVFGKDFIYAAVTAKCVLDFDIGEITPVENPLDILCQVIMSMTVTEKWDIDELYSFIRSSSPFRELPRRHFDLVVEMLSGKYADSRIRELSPRVYVDRLDNTIQAKDGTSYLLFMSGGTIPDTGTFDLRLKDTKSKIGELDEEFVWERRLGDSFPLGNQVWRIQQITHNDVIVTPESRAISIIPFWKAEEQNRDFHFSEKIGLFLERMDALIGKPEMKTVLENEYYMDGVSAGILSEYLEYERLAINADLPHRHHLVIENYNDPDNRSGNKQVILHTFWGGRVNKPFVIALSAFWEERYGYPLQFYADNDCILLSLPHDFQESEIFTFINSKDIEELLRTRLESTGYFGSRFRENAGRALLLPRMNFDKRMPLWLNRLRSKKLLDSVLKYSDFPILLETWRTCLHDDFDLENLRLVLGEIVQGKIGISSVVTAKASPFADNVIWRQTNKYVYEDDTPVGGKTSELKNDLIREIVFSSQLRPEIPAEVIRMLDAKLKRTAAGYAPDSFNELLAWVNERRLIPVNEWLTLTDSVKIENPAEFEAVMKDIGAKTAVIKTGPNSASFVVSLENIPYVAKVFGLDPEQLSYTDISGSDLDARSVISAVSAMKKNDDDTDGDADYLFDFLSGFLSYYCPVPSDFPENLFGIDNRTISPVLESLAENEIIILDRITAGTQSPEICTVENLERLLRMTRSARQIKTDPLPAEKLQLFLAALHGFTDRKETVEGLQEILEKLFCYPANVNAWEEYIIPSRMKTYYKSWLDNLTGEYGLVWLGTGNKKITPIFGDDIGLVDRPDDPEALQIPDRLFADRKGRYNFYDILSISKSGSVELAGTLWDLTWKGIISNDSFDTFRKGFLNSFSAEIANSGEGSKKISFNRWKSTRPDSGNWYIVNYPRDKPDPIETEELKKDRIRFLFKRYGIIFRALIDNELPPFSWKNLQKTLRLMELSGEVLTGYFFENIPGIQFISFDAYRLLQSGLPDDAVYWMNAADPASLCGIKIDGLKNGLPQRNVSNVTVYRGSRLVVASHSSFKKIEILADHDDPMLQEYFSFFKEHLSRQFAPVKKIFIEEINGESALKSPYLQALKDFGFKTHYKGLELWKTF
jgi:ATP-dependent helicase Lhr and Lhr-like helicase